MTTATDLLETSPVDEHASPPVAALFDEHGDFVWRVLGHFGVDDTARDDAVQDVFVTAHRRWSSFEGRSSARSWLFGIARRIASRYRRTAHSHARRFAPSDTPEPGSTEPFARLHAADSLATLLGHLDPDKRSAFILSELEGMTAPEIADALRVPVGTVYSRLRASWRLLGREAQRERTRLRAGLAGRHAATPSPDRRRRIWAMVAAGVNTPGQALPTATTAGWLGQLQWAVVGAAVMAGLLGAGAATVTRDPASHTEATRARVVAAKPDPNTAPSAPSIATRPTPPAIVPTNPIIPEPPEPVPPVARGAAPVVVPTVPSPEDPLAAELALMQQVQQALVQSRGEAALALLREHARRFPRGQLGQERDTATIKALCAAGRAADAARRARALGRDDATVCPP